jgi:hypothetical protein
MDRKSRVRIGHARRVNVTSQTIAKYVLFSIKCRKHQKRSIGILDLILIHPLEVFGSSSRLLLWWLSFLLLYINKLKC